MSSMFYTVEDVRQLYGDISLSKAYKIVQSLNQELKEKGYYTFPGRISRQYFEERHYGVSVPERLKKTLDERRTHHV